jgi:hypothetical protein
MQQNEISYRRYVLGQLRMARIRAQMLVTEIDTAGKAVKAGWIEPDQALAWMTIEAMALVQSEPAATNEYEAMGETS